MTAASNPRRSRRRVGELDRTSISCAVRSSTFAAQVECAIKATSSPARTMTRTISARPETLHPKPPTAKTRALCPAPGRCHRRRPAAALEAQLAIGDRKCPFGSNLRSKSKLLRRSISHAEASTAKSAQNQNPRHRQPLSCQPPGPRCRSTTTPLPQTRRRRLSWSCPTTPLRCERAISLSTRARWWPTRNAAGGSALQ